MREIALSEFITGVEHGSITETVFIGNNLNRIYGKLRESTGPKPYEIVYAKVP